MELFPAIDLIGGQAVRLFQGDYARQQTFGDPSVFAAEFAKAGARNLHLVDLDGAKAGEQRNFATVQTVLAAVPDLFVELGGGIRDEATIVRCLDAGVGRVILGTAALKDPAFTRDMLRRYGDAIAIGIDARGGRVAVEGWLDTSDTDSVAFCKEMQACGARYIIYTDISRDGAGQGVNRDIYKELQQIEGLSFTASGGVSTLADITALRDQGLYAAIVGKALYTGAIALKAALAAAKQ